MRKRLLLWVGLAVCPLLLGLLVLAVTVAEPSRKWDPEILKGIAVGMTVQDVEELVGIPLAAVINDRSNVERNMCLPTTRRHRLPPHVIDEGFTIWFDEAGKVAKTELGSTFAPRPERFVEKIQRWSRQ